MTKKIIAIVLVMTMMFSSIISVFAEETDSDHFSSEYGENLLEYLQGEDGKRLILRTNYSYMSFVEKFNSDVLSLYLLNMADLLIDSGAKPDKEKYMKVLINIIATYDLDNADVISKQKKLDNLKGIEDYAKDCAKMGANAISVMAGTSPATTELENAISVAVDGMSVLIDNTDNWVSALSNLETVVQDYSAHYEFLEIIEKNSNDNNLKLAASTLREGMSKAMKIKLDTYSEISNENFENFKEFFFTDVFFEVAKQTAEYESDETLRFFVDSGDSIISSMDVLGDSWELGTMIGTLVGNVVAGGENLINRVLEMMAIYDVSVILQDYLINTQNKFLSNIGNEKEESYLNKYMSFSQYLIGCRIRGEYCLYSIVANDAGLLNWFNKKSAKEAKEWYDNKVEKIKNIQNSLLLIKDNSMNENYKWNFINALLNNQASWNTPSFGNGSSMTTQISFMDINFDGDLELVTDYMTGSGGTCVEVYGYKDDEIFKYNIDKEAKLIDIFNYYYDKNKDAYRIFGTDTTNFCSNNSQSHKDMSNYELVVIGETIYKDFYSSSCPLNGYYILERKSDVREGYIEGVYNYNLFGPYNEKSDYEEINSKRLNGLLSVNVKRTFIGCDEWKSYSDSKKREILEKSYDSFTYDVITYESNDNPSYSDIDKISSEEAEDIALQNAGGDKYGATYVKNVNYNGEEYYLINIKWRVDDGDGKFHYSHIGYSIVSLDGKNVKNADYINGQVQVY